MTLTLLTEHALLVIAHGSSLDASNNEVKSIIDSLKPKLQSKFGMIQAAFLELCAPTIAGAMDDMANSGIKNITVLPFFLNQGRHVVEDVPHQISIKSRQYPDIKITSLPYLGSSELMPRLIVGLLKN